MDTTARRALSDLIDQLCVGAPEVALPVVPDTVPAVFVAPQLEPAQPAVAPAAREEPPPVPPQRTPPPATVLPGGARSAILWRSR